MKFAEAVENIKNDRGKSYEALKDGEKLTLFGDNEEFYIIEKIGLFAVGTPFYVFDLDWEESK